MLVYHFSSLRSYTYCTDSYIEENRTLSFIFIQFVIILIIQKTEEKGKCPVTVFMIGIIACVLILRVTLIWSKVTKFSWKLKIKLLKMCRKCGRIEKMKRFKFMEMSGGRHIWIVRKCNGT